MDTKLLGVIHQQNPWLQSPGHPIIQPDHYINLFSKNFINKKCLATL